jgi:hypothetical protein
LSARSKYVKEKTLLRLFRDDTTAGGRGHEVPCVGAARPSRSLRQPNELVIGTERYYVGLEVEPDRLEPELPFGAQDRSAAQDRYVGAVLVPGRPAHTIDEQRPDFLRSRGDLARTFQVANPSTRKNLGLGALCGALTLTRET